MVHYKSRYIDAGMSKSSYPARRVVQGQSAGLIRHTNHPHALDVASGSGSVWAPHAPWTSYVYHMQWVPGLVMCAVCSVCASPICQVQYMRSVQLMTHEAVGPVQDPWASLWTE